MPPTILFVFFWLCPHRLFSSSSSSSYLRLLTLYRINNFSLFFFSWDSRKLENHIIIGPLVVQMLFSLSLSHFFFVLVCSVLDANINFNHQSFFRSLSFHNHFCQTWKRLLRNKSVCVRSFFFAFSTLLSALPRLEYKFFFLVYVLEFWHPQVWITLTRIYHIRIFNLIVVIL